MPGSSFMHIVDINEITGTISRKKNEDYQSLRLILEMKAPNFTGSRLGVPYAYNSTTSSHSSFLFLSNVYSKGEHMKRKEEIEGIE
jgi:hypothetical protein